MGELLNRADFSGDGLAESSSPSTVTTFGIFIRWAAKGGLALLDQGLTSGSNFLIGVLLARWLAPDQYGAYALAFAIYLLLLLLYQSLLLEPMTVFGGSAYSKCLRGYFRCLLWLHLLLGVVVLTALGASAGIARGFQQPGGLPGALAGISLAAPCILLFWLARRIFYLQLNLAYAAGGSALYCVLVILGLVILFRHSGLTPFTAFLLMGAAALATSLLLLVRLRMILKNDAPPPSLPLAWRRHWQYGRWALLGCLAGWIPAYVYYPILSTFGTMAQTGQLKAVMNFDLPVQQGYAALSLLFLPYAARVYGEGGKGSMRALAQKMTLLFVSAAFLYWAILIPLRSQAFHLLYGYRYAEVTDLLPIVALDSIFWAAISGPALVLRAMESPASVFIGRSAASLISLTLGVLATRSFGLRGVVWAMALSAASSFIAMLLLLRHKIAHLSVTDLPERLDDRILPVV